jgi:hypothetical protein
MTSEAEGLRASLKQKEARIMYAHLSSNLIKVH